MVDVHNTSISIALSTLAAFFKVEIHQRAKLIRDVNFRCMPDHLQQILYLISIATIELCNSLLLNF